MKPQLFSSIKAFADFVLANSLKPKVIIKDGKFVKVGAYSANGSLLAIVSGYKGA